MRGSGDVDGGTGGPGEWGSQRSRQLAPGVLLLSRPGEGSPDGGLGGASGGGSAGGSSAGPGGGRGAGRRSAPRRPGVGARGAGRARLRRAAPRIALAIAAAAAVLGTAVVAGRPAAGPTAVADALWSGPDVTASAGPASTSPSPSRPSTGTPSAAPPGARAPSAVASVDWVIVMTQLDAARSAALASLDASLLVGYAATGSPALADDARLVEQLQVRGLRPVGLATAIVSAEPEESPSGSAVLRVVDERGAYTLVDRAGAVVERVAGSGARTWIVTLQRTAVPSPQGDPGWRVESVSAVD